jgi:hypothetical protein
MGSLPIASKLAGYGESILVGWFDQLGYVICRETVTLRRPSQPIPTGQQMVQNGIETGQWA